MTKLTKAQEKRLEELFYPTVYYNLNGQRITDLEIYPEIKQHLADELATQKKKFYSKKGIC